MSAFGSYAIYQESSGQILRIVVCDGHQIDAQAGPGESWISVDPGVNDISHRVEHYEPPAISALVPLGAPA